MKRRILSLLLALTMALTLFPATALAEGESEVPTLEISAFDEDTLLAEEETGAPIFDNSGIMLLADEEEGAYVAQIGEGETAQQFASLNTAFSVSQDGDTITLLEDVELDNVISISGKAITLDLNGCSITRGNDNTVSDLLRIEEDGGLTVRDSGTDGEIYSSNFKFDSDSDKSYIGIGIRANGLLTVESGTVSGYRAIYAQEGSDVTVTGDAEVTGSYAGLWILGGDVKVDGGTVVGDWGGICQFAGTLTVDGTAAVTSTKGYYGIYCQAELADVETIIAGGTVTAHNPDSPYAVIGLLAQTYTGEAFDANVDVEDGVITGDTDGIRLSGKISEGTVALHMSDGEVQSVADGGSAISIMGNCAYTDGAVGTADTRDSYPAVAYISGGRVYSDSDDATTSSDSAVYIVGKGAEVYVSGTAELEAEAFGIAGNGSHSGSTDNAGTVISIDGGSVVSRAATGIYHPQYGVLEITGGEITGENTGIEIRAGELSISGGTITGNGIPSEVGPNGNGTTTSGVGVAVAQHTTKLPIHMTVTGGTIRGFSPLYESNPQQNGPEDIGKVSMSVEDGTFEIINEGTTAVYSEDCTDFITGGTFSSDPTEYLAEDCTTALGTDGLYRVGLPVTVTFDANGGSAVEDVTVSYGGVVEEPTTTWEGYAFLGWYTEDGELYDFAAPVTGDLTLTAKWNEVVTTPDDAPAGVDEIQVAPSTPVIEESSVPGADEVIEALEEGVEQEGVTDAAKDLASDSDYMAGVAAKAKAVLELGDGENVTLVVETSLNISVTDVNDGDSFTLDITPTYSVTAIAADGRETTVVEDAPLTVTRPVELTIPLPSDFTGEEQLFIHHLKDGLTYVYEGTVEDGKLIFENPHGFSLFTISRTGAQASVGETGYATLQDAVEAVRYGETIVVYESGLSAEVSGNKLFYVVMMDKDAAAPTLTAAEGYDLVVKELEDGTLRCVVSRQQAFSGGTAPVREIAVEESENGTVEVWPEEAKQGTTVTITVDPDRGYEVEAVLVTAEKNGGELAVTEKGDNQYTFRMPNSDVTVEVTFRPATGGAAVSGDLTIAAPTGWVNPYSDVAAGDWYYGAVGYATANGLMTGTSATTFAPEGSMNRSMVWTVIARLAGQTISGANWAEDARTWAVAQGVSDGTNPGGSVTREELVTMLYRYAGSPAMNVPELALIGSYPDSVSVSDWAQNAFAWALSQGIIDGRDGKLAAGESVTRAEAATILARFHLAV